MEIHENRFQTKIPRRVPRHGPLQPQGGDDGDDNGAVITQIMKAKSVDVSYSSRELNSLKVASSSSSSAASSSSSSSRRNMSNYKDSKIPRRRSSPNDLSKPLNQFQGSAGSTPLPSIVKKIEAPSSRSKRVTSDSSVHTVLQSTGADGGGDAQQKRRYDERFRAEVYAINAILKRREQENLEALRLQMHNKQIHGEEDAVSWCSDYSSDTPVSQPLHNYNPEAVSRSSKGSTKQSKQPERERRSLAEKSSKSKGIGSFGGV